MTAISGSRGAVARAEVLLGDRVIGVLHYQNGNCWFDYQDLMPDHPVLGQRFEEDPAHARGRSPGVPTWFANLLPERGSGLRRLINSRLGVVESHDFHLALHLGGDLPGAVVVRLDGDPPADLPPGADPSSPEDDLLSFSLSGMQLKFSMLPCGDGFRLPGPGELGDWIVKLPSQVHLDLPANEQAMMRWAGLVGIDVPEHRLVAGTSLTGLPEGVVGSGDMAFAIRRFDRTAEGRVHQEDFAQVLGVRPADKARREARQELLAQVVTELCPPEDLDELVRRIVFCIGTGNTDEHLKNWSLRYPDGRQARISPAYDFVSSTVYPAFRSSKLTLSVAGQRDIRYLTPDHFRRLADEVGLDPERVVGVVGRTVDAMRSTWPEAAADAALPPLLRQHIDERFAAVPLLG